MTWQLTGVDRAQSHCRARRIRIRLGVVLYLCCHGSDGCPSPCLQLRVTHTNWQFISRLVYPINPSYYLFLRLGTSFFAPSCSRNGGCYRLHLSSPCLKFCRADPPPGRGAGRRPRFDHNERIDDIIYSSCLVSFLCYTYMLRLQLARATLIN
jgi:hypothetical protein